MRLQLISLFRQMFLRGEKQLALVTCYKVVFCPKNFFNLHVPYVFLKFHLKMSEYTHGQILSVEKFCLSSDTLHLDPLHPHLETTCLQQLYKSQPSKSRVILFAKSQAA